MGRPSLARHTVRKKPVKLFPYLMARETRDRPQTSKRKVALLCYVATSIEYGIYGTSELPLMKTFNDCYDTNGA